jgi:urea transport system ATP-binding protein
VRLGIGRKFQTPAIFSSLTVFQNLEVAVGFRNRLQGLFRPLPQEDVDHIHATLDQVGLLEQASKRASVLSHWGEAVAGIGMLLAQEPKLLLLDEPVAGLTRPERERTGELLQDIAHDHSVLVVEHDMEFVRQFASKVTVLHLGRVLSEGTMEMVHNRTQRSLKLTWVPASF